MLRRYWDFLFGMLGCGAPHWRRLTTSLSGRGSSPTAVLSHLGSLRGEFALMRACLPFLQFDLSHPVVPSRTTLQERPAQEREVRPERLSSQWASRLGATSNAFGRAVNSVAPQWGALAGQSIQMGPQ